jgi:hypothetical protein
MKTKTKESEVEVPVYLPGSECCPSLLPVLYVHILKTAGDVVAAEDETETKEGEPEVEVLEYLPGSECCLSLLPVLCVQHVSGGVVGNE